MTDTTNQDFEMGFSEDAASLDAFTAELFSADKAHTNVKTSEEENEHQDPEHSSPDDGGADHSEVDGADGSEGTEDAENNEPSEETDDSELLNKGKKKSRFQERIDDLTAKLREGDRQRQTLEDQLTRAIAKLDEAATGKKPEVEGQTKETFDGLVEPTADDTLEDGSPKYPMGEFDPKLLRDLTRFDRAVERAHEQKVQAEQKQATERQQEFNSLQTAWNGKVEAVKETYPDYVEKGQTLLNELQGVPEHTAIYLTENLMAMDHGPHVFYYLAEHPEEARAIVNSSPQKALMALGRIEARFEIAAQEQSGKETKLRISKAPEPAGIRTRGSSAAPPQIDLETASLDDFDMALFPNRKRR